MSFVKGRSIAKQARVAKRFIAGFLVSSIFVFAVLGIAGSATTELVTRSFARATLVAILASALISDIVSLRRQDWCCLTIKRQTPKDIQLRLGPGRAALAWGLDTGLVFTTFRVSAIGWALMACTLTGIAPWWIGAAYAFGFLLPLAAGWVAALRLPGEDPTIRLAEALSRRTPLARMSTVVALSATLTSILTRNWVV
jgi:hypothetical protein